MIQVVVINDEMEITRINIFSAMVFHYRHLSDGEVNERIKRTLDECLMTDRKFKLITNRELVIDENK